MQGGGLREERKGANEKESSVKNNDCSCGEFAPGHWRVGQVEELEWSKGEGRLLPAKILRTACTVLP